jgi:hypothetical protein
LPEDATVNIKLVRHLWGVDLTHGLAQYVPHWREVGYEALEFCLQLVPDRTQCLRFLKDESFQWVPQILSHGIELGGSVREHLDSLREQMEECVDLEPLFFNAHSGADTWSLAEAEDFYSQAVDLEKKIGIALSHETHRRRYFGTPWRTAHILRRLPSLRITCDFSHWVCVCERLLPDLGETISLAAQHCHHIHARVGYAEGPQVPDPSAPEYAAELASHEAWWEQIWQSQKDRGYSQSTLTPEFGPPPYMHTLPHTNVPVADVTAVCDWMAKRQHERFARRS